MSYQTWKSSVLGLKIGDGECVSLVVNNPRSYTASLYPGVSWPSIIPPVVGAKQMAGKSNAYVQWIANNVNDPNQLPHLGDIMVFDATPKSGYTNMYNNPYGHTGVCDSASPSGYYLLGQQAGVLARVQYWPWKFRPCLGWLRPQTPGTSPAPAPVPSTPTTKHTIFLPPTTGPWHLYQENGPYLPAYAKGIIVPANYGGLTYDILADKGNGIYVIQSVMYGRGALWTKGSDVVIK